MENSIGVGLIVGLTFASSIYVWSNEKFSGVQKTILLICIIFPPAQWLGILLVLAYNSYTINKSIEKVQERKVEVVKVNLDNSISNLTDLKNKGILTELEYYEKVANIRTKKAQQGILNSTEYKQLKSLFDSGILTKEEFDSKVKLIQNVSEKEVDVEEINNVVNSVNATYLDSVEEKQQDKKGSSTPIYVFSILFFVILLGSVIIYSDNSNNETKVDSTYVEPMIVDTSAIAIENSYQEPLMNKDVDSNKIQIEQIQTFRLFSDVSGIYPKETSFNEVKLILGEPDFIDITKTVFDENSGKFFGGDKILKYKSLGIELLFEKDDINMSAVGFVSVLKNFNAKSTEGIYIGMPEDECQKILRSKYYMDFETDDYKSYTKKENGKTISVWFRDGKLDRLTIY